ncbi:hypothetical protein [[Phormidium] sp. ETS-05]|uniref:hypothetical protein n=1 Tax=[Phormidium] sp. ETS-05 TaxID=222819 RepID=UPI0018EEFCCA|nr:hypothetical protein [[Phormidium] sp. ETS-05]
MGGLQEVLKRIKEKPGMYIGRASVTDLFMFIVGYEFARGELDIDLNDWEADFHENFHDFVEKKYNLHTSSWASIIMLYCRDEKTGFERFFQVLEEFERRDKGLDASSAEPERDIPVDELYLVN